MEEEIFPAGAVAPLLEDNFVEARLHTDGEVNIERIRELQQELTSSVANPYYVLQEAEFFEVLDKKDGFMGQDTFAEFLNAALRKHAPVLESAQR